MGRIVNLLNFRALGWLEVMSAKAASLVCFHSCDWRTFRISVDRTERDLTVTLSGCGCQSAPFFELSSRQTAPRLGKNVV